MPIPAGTARGKRFRLYMASSSTLVGAIITWICVVACSHTHVHVPSTLHMHDLHTFFGLVGAGECPCRLPQHGAGGAGCIWQAPGYYWPLPSRGYVPYLAHTHTSTSTYQAHCTSATSTPSGGLVGARECPCQLAQYGKISAGCVWKLQNMSGCYFSVDMCRILLTHTPPHNHAPCPKY